MTLQIDKRKGQSAIEYLTTYGWMLLVVAIVGGAIFTTVQGQSQLQSVTGYAGADVGIDNFGLTSNGLAVQVVSQGSDPVEITNLTITNEDSPTAYPSSPNTGQIPLGDSREVVVDTVAGAGGNGVINESTSSQTYTSTVTYNVGDLTDLQASGSVTGNFQILDTS
jgi:hypothetical protein